MKAHIENEEIMAVIRSVQPEIVGFAWDNKLKNLSVIFPNGVRMEACEFNIYSLTRYILGSIEDFLEFNNTGDIEHLS